MAVRFNPPPGWRVPPGFRPESGWAPDPAWPPAPPGWNYWVDDQAAARPARAETPAEATTVMAPIRAAAPTPSVAPPPAPTATYGAPVATLAPPPPPPPSTAPSVGPLGGSLDDGRESASPVSAALRTVGDKLRDAGDRRSAQRAQRAQAAAAAAPPPRAGGTRTAKSGRPSSMLITGVAVACLAFGCILGVTVSMMRSSDAAQALVDADRKVAAAEQKEAEATEANEKLVAQRADVEKREQELKEREKAAEAQEAELASKQQAFEQSQADQQQQEQQPPQQEEPQEGAAWFYWDCNAAREAGAAPIQNGQPAYRGALDANGNGIACEDGE